MTLFSQRNADRSHAVYSWGLGPNRLTCLLNSFFLLKLGQSGPALVIYEDNVLEFREWSSNDLTTWKILSLCPQAWHPWMSRWKELPTNLVYLLGNDYLRGEKKTTIILKPLDDGVFLFIFIMKNFKLIAKLKELYSGHMPTAWILPLVFYYTFLLLLLFQIYSFLHPSIHLLVLTFWTQFRVYCRHLYAFL